MNTVVTKRPSASRYSFAHCAKSSRSVPEQLTGDEVFEVPQLLGTFLEPDGYVFIYFRFDKLRDWCDFIYKTGYVVMPYSYTFILNYTSAENWNPKGFTQQTIEYRADA